MRHDQQIVTEIWGRERGELEGQREEGKFIQVLAMHTSGGDFKSSPVSPHANGKASVMSIEPEINTSQRLEA